MGDVAMVVPVLKALVVQHPKVKVTVVSKESYRPFFETIERVNFFAADVEGRHKGFFGLLRLYSDLKKLKINAVADLHNVLRSNIITKLFAFRGKRTATTDKARAEKKALTRSHNKIFRALAPVAERHAAVFKELGLPIDLSQPALLKKQQLSDGVLAFTGPKTKIWIGVAPFAQHRSKIYPLDLMRKVIESLAENPQHQLFLFGGGKSETFTLRNFAENKENIIVVAGSLKLKQELELISNLDVMLSMDSGNAHLAAMFRAKVVTLWGATHPYAGYAPFAQPLENALVSDREAYPLLPTSVYGNKKVKGYEDAMRTISPEEVVKKVYDVIKNG